MRGVTVIILLLLLLAGGGAATLYSRHRRVEAAAAAASRPAMLLVSGDTAGWITPCGCTSNQSGGLLRRASYLAGLRRSANVIYADVGGAPTGAAPYQRVKFEAILAGEKGMSIAAHNLGGPELLLGAEFLRDVSARVGVPLLSANARDAQGRPLADAMCLAEAGGQRVALVGVVSPQFATADVRVEDPKRAILEVLATARGQYDRVVVLAYLPEEELAALAAELPEADAVIGGPTGQAMAPRPAGPSLLAAATNKGKFLVQLDLPATSSASAARIRGKVVEMGPSIPDDAGQLANLRLYQAILAARDFPAAQTGLAPKLPPGAPATYRLAGSESCRTCHVEESRAWDASAHAHAWQTLQPRGFHVDPYCMQCHTTGYGLPGGFDSLRATPDRLGVGCENCHGPSQAHVKDPTARTTFAAADQCTRCHDHENSPTFEYSGHWARIQHGKAAKPLPKLQAAGEVKS